jgi:hypothetical protein
MMQEPTRRTYEPLNVWALSVAAALSTIAIALLSFPVWTMFPVRTDYAHHTSYFVVHRFAGMYHIGATVLFAFWAGIGAAILALVYNAMIRKRQ